MMMNVVVNGHNKKSERNHEKNFLFVLNNIVIYTVSQQWPQPMLEGNMWCKWRKAPWISKDSLDILEAEMQNAIWIAQMQVGRLKISTRFAFL